MKILLLFLFLSYSTTYSDEISIINVRELFLKSVKDETSCKKLIDLLADYNETNNQTLAGYKACASMIMGSHAFNPMTKYAYFKEGKILLEKAIKADKENIELCFLRFTIQSNIPHLLGYNQALVNDKRILLASVHTIKDLHLKQMIISYFQKSTYLSLTEKKILHGK